MTDREKLIELLEDIGVSKWISVEERLPEKDGTYIIRSDVGSVYTSHFYAERRYTNGYTKKANWTKRGKVNVTPWMPRPQPPREE